MFVYISIGNSDDELTQKEWADYCFEVQEAVELWGSQTHGVWFSLPSTPWQNGCWCFEIEDSKINHMKRRLEVLAKNFRQDWISWVQTPVTDRIEPWTEL
jgi:hypothetical protein